MKKLQDKMEFIFNQGFTKCIFCIYGYICVSGYLEKNLVKKIIMIG